MRHKHQKLPTSWDEREALRDKGQFWTPNWVAEGMVSYVIGGGANHIFDPAVGAGAFFAAAKLIAKEENRQIELLGTEIDADSLRLAQEAGLSPDDLGRVEIRDFVVTPPFRQFSAVVANPPYIRHHRLSDATKRFVKHFGASLIGRPLDGRAGYHVYFLLRALESLSASGRLAFIMPADVCEGVFSKALWQWILSKYRLDAVVTFAPQATPFPSVDTNAIVFMLCNEKPNDSFQWARCLEAETMAFKRWVRSAFRSDEGLEVRLRFTKEALRTGLSRSPVELLHSGPVLRDFATVVRGIATGSNNFFFLTKGHARQLNIPDKWLIPALGRTRDAPEEIITAETLRMLEDEGRPTQLLSLDSTPVHKLPGPLQDYVAYGEELGLNKRPLISSRRPWYKMEVRTCPPFLFAYLGRRNARFIRNLAGVVPLTGFLCLYPVRSDATFTNNLWNVLRDPETIANLPLVGKSYGFGAIKVEPRALEQLPIPASVSERWELPWRQREEQINLIAV